MMRKVNSVVSDCETTRYIIERQARLSQNASICSAGSS